MKRFISFLFAFVTILLFTFSTSTIVRMDMGEPVPGAEILVEQPDGVTIAHCITDNNGEFTFSFPEGFKIPKSGELILTITPPQITAKGGGDPLSGMNYHGPKIPQKITVKYVIKNGMIDAWSTAPGGPYEHAYGNAKGVKEVMDVYDKMKVGDKGHTGLNGSEIVERKIPTLKFVLLWNPPVPGKSNRGGFAVSGKNTG